MKKCLPMLSFTVILVCIVLLLVFIFFDIIDWIVPGSFPNWVYVAEEAVWAAIGVFSLVMLIKKACRQRKEDMKIK